ncbi:DUF6161 domain-containing protein [Flavobacterium terrisoli]|uniref:DUF6161 domain-containing protein n=1 Tax=Flavobacterium terrisoli TaxID=3242195 RepID=UPI002543DB71|nr:DUF6161 domain-containing protein [Flavobacterium buctense]
MDIKSFRKLVQDSPIKDKLNSLEATLNYPVLNTTIEFKGIQSIYKFVLDQVIGWNEVEKLPSYFSPSKAHFERLKSKLIQLSDYFNEQIQNQFDNNWNSFLTDFTNEKNPNNYYNFLIDCPETDFILKVNNHNPTYTQGAIDFIAGRNLNINNNKDFFVGALMAYEFKSQNDSEILHRRNNEKLSLSKIRDKYNEYITEAEQQLNGYLSDAKDNLKEHFDTVDKLKTEKNKNFEDWFTGVQGGFDTFFSNASDNIKTNEDLYKEKLRLEAPAKYWRDRAEKLKKEGNKHLNWLIGVSIVATVLLFTLLMLLGTDYFKNAFSDNIKGIKWSVILITIVSLLAFSIKILSKMTFSSFHLSRDAEEREQLTHFYLALKKDTTIEPEERQLILQSLFSRADTGLLKEDSSPTMPTTSIIEKFTGGK